MVNLNDAEIRTSVFNRIDALGNASVTLWGKMNVNQMPVHCDLPLQIATGELPVKDLSNTFSRSLVKFWVLRFKGMAQKNMTTAGELYITG